ncbi:DUF3787 domain-containing protein [Dethiobacter alkaliphilus]|uniref:DUF3787 domain-containing protein n=1 Tax=Dethiobacter alkaliphilus TaxID=427926 RepID=UPI002225C4B2|nr:DUF3787 domain-containing protein [Dethiobacter alkaliphilus]MCW3489442.1 DUF3787 domain-containing protein [Dethiobacter alkaliphilus]
MADKKFKQTFMGMPIEKHDTAAWADIEDMKAISQVNLPAEEDIRNAKEYVDTNQK